jgi:hypothetical protein
MDAAFQISIFLVGMDLLVADLPLGLAACAHHHFRHLRQLLLPWS